MIKRTARRWALVWGVLALPAAASATAPAAACGPAALADGTVVGWDAASEVTGDFNMDGEEDVAYLGRDGEETLVLIAACRGEEVLRRWMFPVPPTGACDGPPRLEAASLLLGEEVVSRVCASPTSASECAHLRRTNRERQALMDAGYRALRVAAPGCPGMLLWWAPELGGFTRRPG